MREEVRPEVTYADDFRRAALASGRDPRVHRRASPGAFFLPIPHPDIPRFADERSPVSGEFAESGDAEGAGPAIPAARYVDPAIVTRNNRLAGLIDACYPAGARRAGEERRVTVCVAIDAGGRASAWNVERGSGFPRLDAAVGCVIRRLEFLPGRRDGRAVDAAVMLPIVFRLD